MLLVEERRQWDVLVAGRVVSVDVVVVIDKCGLLLLRCCRDHAGHT